MHFVQWILFLHVLSAVWMSVGILGCLAVAGRLHPGLGEEALHLTLGLISRLHRLYTLPGMMVAGLFGISLVTATGYRFTQLWIAGAAFLFVVLFHLSLFGVSPRLAALTRARRSPRNGSATTSIAELADRTGWRRLLVLQAVLLVFLLLLMTAKP